MSQFIHRLLVALSWPAYKELTFEQKQHISVIIAGYNSHSSNRNKYEHELFAYIEELMR